MLHDSIKNNIIDTYREMHNALGIRMITIDMIARRCGISKKTFYKYFTTKDELVRFVTDSSLDALSAQFAEIAGSDRNPLQKLMDIIALTYARSSSISKQLLEDVRATYPEIYRKVVQFKENQASVIHGILKSGIDAGMFRDINPALVVNAFMGALDRILAPDFILQNNLTSEQAMKSFYVLSMHGLLNPESAPVRDAEQQITGS